MGLEAEGSRAGYESAETQRSSGLQEIDAGQPRRPTAGEVYAYIQLLSPDINLDELKASMRSGDQTASEKYFSALNALMYPQQQV